MSTLFGRIHGRLGFYFQPSLFVSFYGSVLSVLSLANGIRFKGRVRTGWFYELFTTILDVRLITKYR